MKEWYDVNMQVKGLKFQSRKLLKEDDLKEEWGMHAFIIWRHVIWLWITCINALLREHDQREMISSIEKMQEGMGHILTR